MFTEKTAIFEDVFQSLFHKTAHADFPTLFTPLTAKDPFLYLKHLENLFVHTTFVKRETTSETEHVQHIAQSVLSECFWPELQLPFALSALISHQLDLPLKKPFALELFANGAPPFDSKNLSEKNLFPNTLLSAKLGIVSLLLAILLDDSTLAQSVYQLTEWQQSTLNHNFLPFQGLWEKQDYKESLFAHYILFQLAGLIFQDKRFIEIAENITPYLENIEDYTFLLSILYFYKSLPPHPFTTTPLLPLNIAVDPLFATAFRRTKNWSLAATLVGNNTGFGALHKKGVSLCNFGPHVGSLAEMEGFGIYRSINRYPGPSDFIYSTSGANFSMCGSIGLHPFESYPSQWMNATLSLQDRILMTTLRPLDPTLVTMVFFINASQCTLDGNLTFQPNALAHYKGLAKPALFSTGEEQILITPDQAGRMHLIPLSVEGHFWGATFLLAYEVTEETLSASWKIY